MDAPRNLAELTDLVRTTPRVLAVGARTKPRLSAATNATLVDMRSLAGIVEYQPSEYTLTVRAGTPLAEINAALAAHGQYLPFDPPFAAAGATIGGTVAANLSGPGRFRYGGIRDFILGVTCIDGTGRVIRAGGKVVKNAAGFDLPKFLVGSLGRLGIITELTFKVFPRPAATCTRRLTFDSHEDAIAQLAALARSRFEPDALDYLPTERTLLVRLAGPVESIAQFAREVGGEPIDERVWQTLPSFDAPVALKASTCPRAFLNALSFIADSPDFQVHLSGGGSTAWIGASTAPTQALNKFAHAMDTPTLVLRGDTPSLWLGPQSGRLIDVALSRVFDPYARFPPAT